MTQSGKAKLRLRLWANANFTKPLCPDEGLILCKLEEFGQRPDHRF